MLDTICVQLDPHQSLNYSKLPLGKRKAWRPGLHSELLKLNKTTGLRLLLWQGKVRGFEVSLSRHYHQSASNSRPLTTQTQVDDAMQTLWREVDAVIIKPTVFPDWWFSRVDLAWNYLIDPQLFIFAHDHATHTRTKKWVVTYTQNNLTTGRDWVGGDLKLKFYDAQAKRRYRNPTIPTQKFFKVLRIEAQLEGKPLRNLLGYGTNVTSLNIRQCYNVFRSLFLEFKPQARAVTRMSTKDEALFYAESEGLNVFRQLLPSMGGLTRRNFKANFAQWKAQHVLFKVDWDAMLPAKFPPPLAKLRMIAASNRP